MKELVHGIVKTGIRAVLGGGILLGSGCNAVNDTFVDVAPQPPTQTPHECILERDTLLITNRNTTARDCPYIATSQTACVSHDKTKLPKGTLVSIAPAPETERFILVDATRKVRVEFRNPETNVGEESWVDVGDLDFVNSSCTNRPTDEVVDPLLDQLFNP